MLLERSRIDKIRITLKKYLLPTAESHPRKSQTAVVWYGKVPPQKWGESGSNRTRNGFCIECVPIQIDSDWVNSALVHLGKSGWLASSQHGRLRSGHFWLTWWCQHWAADISGGSVADWVNIGSGSDVNPKTPDIILTSPRVAAWREVHIATLTARSEVKIWRRRLTTRSDGDC